VARWWWVKNFSEECIQFLEGCVASNVSGLILTPDPDEIMKMQRPHLTLSTLALSAAVTLTSLGSSHREAPGITKSPKVDATDFYMFNSYEAGREDYVTIVANYVPLQDAYGGPNYFTLDEDAVYAIHVSNDGGATPDLSFEFRFTNQYNVPSLNIGGQMVAIPLLATGPVTAGNDATLHLEQSYGISLVAGGAAAIPITEAGGANTTFIKPQDNVGNKTFPDYDAYANQYIYEIAVPGSALPGRVFVGQRKDPFVVNLGEIFDLVNLNPLGPVDGRADDLADANVTSIVIELPKDALTNLPLTDPVSVGYEPVIGAWTTASLPDGAGGLTQVSRLGQPLVNEVVIGVPDKDSFNASLPADDGANFLTYVQYPTLPALLNILFGVTAPETPRADLVSVFLTGVSGLNQPAGVAASEMLRLNTGIAAVAAQDQNNLGVVGGDTAGFPNGRRPGDDVVDIALRAVMGVLLYDENAPGGNPAPSGNLPYTDGATVSAADFSSTFPYLGSPIGGSPNDPSFKVTLEASSDLMNFLAIGNASFDDTEKQLTIPKVAGLDKEFYRLKGETDGIEVSVESVTSQATILNLRVIQ